MRLAGSFAVKGGLSFDTAQLDATYRFPYDIASSCRVTEAPPTIDVARFRKPFTHRAYASDGERRVDFETGPGTAPWAPYSAISRHMTTGVLGFEDGRFFGHEGFDHEAIRNSVRENVRKWRFVRGASTLSMQLAKNLYLSRDKVLGRKIEEAFLTVYLEQALTKEQILELYLNIVEFGPGVYGIENGAATTFRTTPAQLTLSQAFYLASILPSPKTSHFAAGGAPSPGWLKLLRTVMKHSHKRRRITDEELTEGLAEIPIRGSTVPMRDPDAEVPELADPPEPGVPLH
jgi:membrane peptidoglycan carboxypeptidase